ncbi:hypothetical protein WOLCODRAFT_72130 [Wolfiporia cocos MD-104 SS10]|uniref:MINDY deubiquitinase domain-containing protein n=1 Tax=Wolfiporia cocos (strain MD-104) TaxID=742152 RepID=A0A2H3JK45_WOLCO|nr:hypothetical protein WOLCODRAFT_72130 [Wolfiporia cocos MD-104 SS10]
MDQSVPIIDEQNPFYCPTSTAVVFIEALRSQIHGAPPPYTRSPTDFPSFAERLEQSINEDDVYQLLYRSLPAVNSSEVSALHSSFSVPAYDQSTPTRAVRRLPAGDPPGVKAKRKKSESLESFSDLMGPPRNERSFQSVNDQSFELSGKVDKIRYWKATMGALLSPYSGEKQNNVPPASGEYTMRDMERRIFKLEDELYGPPIGTETPRGISVLISRLNALLPGIRLKERLYALGTPDHQDIVDLLARGGHLNKYILEMLRMSEIEVLDLTASLMDQEGLNMGAHDLLHVFTKPNSFLFLTELCMNNASLKDLDLTYIHHLPRLSRLWISNTGIGNDAIFHLVALKRTLSELAIEMNPLIDDDAIPALIALPMLWFLSFSDTSIGMPGLRKLAMAMKRRGDYPDLEVPRACEEYINNLHRKYMLFPQPPLIVDPAACATLSPEALRRNLAAHAAFNPDIHADGSASEMAERLANILKTREEDLVVRELGWLSDNNKVTSEGGHKKEEGEETEGHDNTGNILILRGNIEILPPERTSVSYDFLARLVGEYLLTSSPEVDTSAALSIMPATRSTPVTFSVAFILIGMDLNPLFTGPTSFRPAGEGGELKLFEHAGIKLVHGWLADPDSPEYKVLSHTEDYDTSVNLLVEADYLTKGQLVSSLDPDVPQEGGAGGIYDTLSSEERMKVQDAIIIRDFIDKTQSQLTYHGLFTLASTLAPGELVALFRNSHLSVLHRPREGAGEGGLYTLVTDQVFLHEPSVVWERLEDVEGGMSAFVDADFVRASPAGGDYAGHTAETALAALEAEARALTVEDSAEYVRFVCVELARQLQAEEDEHARQYYAQRERERTEREHAAQRMPPLVAEDDSRPLKKKKGGDCIIM